MSTDAARVAAEAMLEPAAVGFSTNDEERINLSVAISLKRIADTLAIMPDDIRVALYNGITEGIYAARPK